jgi:hypothetical protein
MTAISEKSILAKLLATENVNVEHRKVPTAFFDLENRTVVLPMLKEMTGDVYDLLIGHEVSHALNTPMDGWHSSVSTKGAGYKSFLNVIEDARIERMIKDKYPGLRRSFYNGYKNLYNQDFFGVTKMGIDPNQLKFIDRINLYFKIGNFLNLKFTAEEQRYLDRISTLQTWDDVVKVADELYALSKETKEEEQFQDALAQAQESAEDDESMEQSDQSDQSDQSEQSEQSEQSKSELEESTQADETAEDSDSISEDSTDTETPESGANSDAPVDDFSDEMEEDLEPESATDKNFRQNEDSLLDPNSRENTYNRLGKINPADYVLSIKYFEDNLRFQDTYTHAQDSINLVTFPSDVYKDFLAKNGKFLSAMVQEFERKKMAKAMIRAKTAKTGRINMDKVWAYKITEDLFLQNTVIPNGQNHGMIMYLDLSGSMRYNMQGTTEQLALLASFCKKVRIPFEVYGFTSNNCVPAAYLDSVASRNDLSDKKNLAIANGYFRMIQMITTNSNGNKFKRQIMNILAYGKASNYRDRIQLSQESQQAIGANSSTPLEETIIVGRYLADQFREKYKVEVLSSIFLTDGEGDRNYYTAKHFLPVDPNAPYTSRYDYLDPKNNLVIVDAKTNASVMVPRTYEYNRSRNAILTRGLLAIYKKATNSRVINFYITDRRSAQGLIRDLSYNREIDNENTVRKMFRDNGCVALKNVGGFDDQFLIQGGNSLVTEEDKIDVDAGATKNQILKAFKKMQTSKTGSRAILSEMISAIA